MKNSRKRLKVLFTLAIMSTATILNLFAIPSTVYAYNSFAKIPIVDTSEKGAFNQKLLLYDISTDKSMYNPGSNVVVNIELANYTGNEISNGTVELVAKHLDTQIGDIIKQSFTIGKSEDKHL